MTTLAIYNANQALVGRCLGCDHPLVCNGQGGVLDRFLSHRIWGPPAKPVLVCIFLMTVLNLFVLYRHKNGVILISNLPSPFWVSSSLTFCVHYLSRCSSSPHAACSQIETNILGGARQPKGRANSIEMAPPGHGGGEEPLV